MLRDYFGLSEEVDGIELFPVCVTEWEEFNRVSSKFLQYNYEFLFYRTDANEDAMLFDLIVAIVSNDILKTESLKCDSVKDIELLFSKVTKRNAKYKTLDNGKTWVVELDNGKVIDRDNYDAIRDVLLRQNIIYEPLIVEDELSQKIIDDGIRAMSKRGSKRELESMISYICNMSGVSSDEIQKYSYYRLQCDIEMWQRIEFNRAIHGYRSQGAKIQTINEFKEFEVHKNPYSWDALFTKHDANKEAEMQRMLS